MYNPNTLCTIVLQLRKMSSWSRFCIATGKEHPSSSTFAFCPDCGAGNSHPIVRSANTQAAAFRSQVLTHIRETIDLDSLPDPVPSSQRFFSHGTCPAIAARQTPSLSNKASVRTSSNFDALSEQKGGLATGKGFECLRTTLNIVRGFCQTVSTIESDEEQRVFVKWLKPCNSSLVNPFTLSTQ